MNGARFFLGLTLAFVGFAAALWAYYWGVLWAGWPLGTGRPTTAYVVLLVVGVVVMVAGAIVMFRARSSDRSG